MSFLQRTATVVAIALPLVGTAACISYVVAGSLRSKPPLDGLPLAQKAPPRPATKHVAAVEAERIRPSSEIAAEAFARALALRDATAGSVRDSPRLVPLPKPRPKNLGSSSASR
jgi:hypothetical protein